MTGSRRSQFSEATQKAIRKIQNTRCALCLRSGVGGTNGPSTLLQIEHVLDAANASQMGGKAERWARSVGLLKDDFERTSMENVVLLCFGCRSYFTTEAASLIPAYVVLVYLKEALARLAESSSTSVSDVTQLLQPSNWPADIQDYATLYMIQPKPADSAALIFAPYCATESYSSQQLAGRTPRLKAPLSWESNSTRQLKIFDTTRFRPDMMSRSTCLALQHELPAIESLLWRINHLSLLAVLARAIVSVDVEDSSSIGIALMEIGLSLNSIRNSCSQRPDAPAEQAPPHREGQQDDDDDDRSKRSHSPWSEGKGEEDAKRAKKFKVDEEKAKEEAVSEWLGGVADSEDTEGWAANASSPAYLPSTPPEPVTPPLGPGNPHFGEHQITNRFDSAVDNARTFRGVHLGGIDRYTYPFANVNDILKGQVFGF